MSEILQEQVLKAILEGKRKEATELLQVWAEEYSYLKTITDILEPVLKHIGEQWVNSESISLGQGYVAGKVAEDIMELAAREREVLTDTKSLKGPVIIGNIEDDSHALGRKLVISFLTLEGWDVVDLGRDVPANVFVDQAIEKNASIVAASAMMYKTAQNIKKLRTEIDQRELNGKIQLAVGGAVFLQYPELVKEVGGDGTAPNAISAPSLMDRLLMQSNSCGIGQ